MGPLEPPVYPGYHQAPICRTETACKHCFYQVREMWVRKDAHLSSARANTLPTVIIGTKPKSFQLPTEVYVKLKSRLELLLDEGAEAFADPGCLTVLALLLLLPSLPRKQLLTATCVLMCSVSCSCLLERVHLCCPGEVCRRNVDALNVVC